MITLVSGIPRSGTSLMMRLAAVAGIPALCDGSLKADENNPHGYFEWSPAQHLNIYPNLIDEAEGKCVKVLSHFAPFVPSGREYRCIFMVRDIRSILSSQSAFVTREHSIARFDFDSAYKSLRKLRSTVKAHLMRVCNGKVFFVDYDYLVEKPFQACQNVAFFLEQYDLGTIWEMASLVNQRLRHHKESNNV